VTKLSSTPVRLAHIVIRPLSREDNVQKIALRFSRHITQLHDTEAIIYVIASEISANASETNPLTVHLPELPSWILASLPKSEQRRERHRISYLVLKEAIARAVDQRPSITQHIIVSVDAESTGALCQQVADAMHLTHVTYIKSPEPDEQAHVSSLSHYSQYVLRAADWIVTDAQSQLLALENGLKLRNLTSINDPDRQLLSAHTRKPGCKSSALLFSDIGYSTAAGTLTLFRAFENLRKKGLDVRLTVCGHTEMGESELWSEEKAIQKQRHGSRLALEGFLQRHDVQRLLAQSHIYCIPRRHDDSEDGSVQALLSGIPVVGPEIAEMCPAPFAIRAWRR
jgi:glycosyltransferase involved in cell wall biosynthesis